MAYLYNAHEYVFRGNQRVISDQQEYSNITNTTQKSSCNAETNYDMYLRPHIFPIKW